jgi:dTDP-4-amino-4,6-dideoxygalactose transaminase
MTDMQAALGVSQLERLSVAAAARRTHVSNYSSLLAGLPLKLPVDPADRESSWHLYVVEIDTTRCRASRAQVFAALRAAGIGVNVHYIPIHMQPYYRKLGFAPGQFPAAEAYYAQALSLPLFPQLMAGQQEEVAAVLRRALTA